VKCTTGPGAAVDSKDSQWRTALIWASEYGHVAAVRVLLEAGAAVNYKDNFGSTALSFASENGHEGAVRALIEAGSAAASSLRCPKTTTRAHRFSCFLTFCSTDSCSLPSLL